MTTTYETNAAVVHSFTDAALAAAFFVNPVDLGVVADPFANDDFMKIQLRLQLALSNPADGIHLSSVPIPPALWLMVLALVWRAKSRRAMI